MRTLTITLALFYLFGLHESLGCNTSPNRTVVFLYKQTLTENSVFIRGGISDSHRPGCTTDAATDPCAIGIMTCLLGTIDTYDPYNYWRVGDDHLDWHGPEANQGSYQLVPAEGTPMAWTTDNPLSQSYQELNTFGDHYWMVDMEMDCSQTEEGWFELKGYESNGVGWETDVIGGTACIGTEGGTPPYTFINHMAKCGFVNIFRWGESECTINAF